MVKLLEPFPKTFKVTGIKTEGDKAVASIQGDDEVKNNPVTKEDIQSRLETALNKSK